MCLQYSLRCCDILSSSLIVWQLVPDRRAGDGKKAFVNIGRMLNVWSRDALLSLTLKVLSIRGTRSTATPAGCFAAVYNLFESRLVLGLAWRRERDVVMGR